MMSLFDAALGMIGNQLGQGNNKTDLIQAVIALLGNQQAGGLSGIISQFQQAGLSDIVSSWVGTGQNLPISADQIQQALGGSHLSSIAESAGISSEAAAGGLAEYLPGLIDTMTPDGQIPDTNNIDASSLLSQAASLFGNR
jgi:uncharacterized protein YidB (DUF937 family)